MEIPTPSDCKLPNVRRPFAIFLVLLVVGCKTQPPPGVTEVVRARGGARTQAKALLRVAIVHPSARERQRAALLAGLYACDGGSAGAALRAFGIAQPSGGVARLAAKRLGDALENSGANAGLWRRAADAGWVAAEDRTAIRLRGAEWLAMHGDPAAALAQLPNVEGLGREARVRALLVRAIAGSADAESALRAVAIEFPARFGPSLAGRSLEGIAATFTSAEWARHAQGWLEVGRPEQALRAAQRGGLAAAAVAAQAALRLRRPTVAIGWATRAGERSGAGWLARADAYRQLAWVAEGAQRTGQFAQMAAAGRRAVALNVGTERDGPARLLLAEADVELGKFGEALPLLAPEDVQAQPRWEWVWRRYHFLQARSGRSGAVPTGVGLNGTTRGRRLVAFWRAEIAARGGDSHGFVELADGGYPDLPALWSASRAGRREVAVTPGLGGVAAPPPPGWARDLIDTGRISDVVWAWRADLEAAGKNGSEWLGLAVLANLPPLDAIPLLVKGEPRLATGPWTGVSRLLLERYLPLAFRPELESAARRTGIPPWLLAGVIRQESAWNVHALSAAGAVGLTQVIPEVGREIVREHNLEPTVGQDLVKPANNLTIGALLVARARTAFPTSWTAALASYNAGERRVRAIWDRTGRRDSPEFVESLEIPETWDYVHRVIVFAEGYRILYWREGKPYPWT